MNSESLKLVDITAQPHWLSTGFKFFPYAAQQTGQWWVLRANYCFPEHDLCTLFINRHAIADLTGTPDDPRPLVASIAALHPIAPWIDARVPAMTAELAETVVAAVADYVVYGSESNDPCALCEFAQRDPYERAPPLVSGTVRYRPQPLDEPGIDQVLLCCATPQGDMVIEA